MPHWGQHWEGRRTWDKVSQGGGQVDLLPLCPWLGDLTSLSLYLSVCEMGIVAQRHQ